MGALGRRRAGLDAAAACGLLHPGQAGCAGTRDGVRPCATEPVGTVSHRFEHPRPHTQRLFVCEAHATGHPDPRPLTAVDRQRLRRRRAARRPPRT